jgi:hypothetical protein
MKQLDKIITRKQKQTQNLAYSPIARKAIQTEIKILTEIKQDHQNQLAANKHKMHWLKCELINKEDKIFQRELLLVKVTNMSLQELAQALRINPIAQLIDFINRRDPNYYKAFENEINAHRAAKGLNSINLSS